MNEERKKRAGARVSDPLEFRFVATATVKFQNYSKNPDNARRRYDAH
jgi:hypothetical protein